MPSSSHSRLARRRAANAGASTTISTPASRSASATRTGKSQGTRARRTSAPSSARRGISANRSGCASSRRSVPKPSSSLERTSAIAPTWMIGSVSSGDDHTVDSPSRSSQITGSGTDAAISCRISGERSLPPTSSRASGIAGTLAHVRGGPPGLKSPGAPTDCRRRAAGGGCAAMRLLLALVLALLPAAPAVADPQIFTLAGNGAHDTAHDGEPATAAGVGSYAPLAVLAGGGFVVGSGADGVWRVDAHGTIHLVPGTRELHASGLGALPGGGFLMTDALHGLVRMAGADGSIATVASGLNAPLPVAATPGGGFVVGVENGVRRGDPDGRIHTIAGPTAPGMDPGGLAVATDGSVLVADPAAARLDRVAPGGTFSVEPLPHVTPRGVAALPDGGYLVSDGPREDTGGRVLRVAPDGAITVLASSRRPTLTAPGGLAQELTGESALQAELRFAGPIAALPDGGALLSDDSGAGGLIRYVTPAAPGLLGAAVLRDRDRVFAP